MVPGAEPSLTATFGIYSGMSNPSASSSTARVRGRGAQVDPTNRFERLSLQVLEEHAEQVVSENPEGVRVETRVYPDRTKSVINPVDVPDIHFDWTINPYRGCEHGCVYCYARPTHETLGLSCGVDFETRLVAKHDAPDLLERELRRKGWRGEPIVMSGVTDPYQPVESKLRITRRCLEVMAAFQQPVSIVTKSSLVLRDLDLIERLHEHDAVRCAVSLTTLDNRLASRMEPRACSPKRRLETIRRISALGVPVTVMTAPIIPTLNDRELPALLQSAAEAGASSAAYVFLRLPHQLKAVFTDWLEREFPDRAAHVESLIRQSRDGALYDPTPGKRQRGEGAIAEQIGNVFRVFSKRYGLDRMPPPLRAHKVIPPDPNQPSLFG